MNARRFFLVTITAAALEWHAAPAHAAATVQGFVQYAPTFGDTYNGVTTDDGDHLPGSYAVKAQVFYGRFTGEYRYHRDLSNSQTNARTITEAPGTSLAYPAGQVVVPVFTASDGESEFRLEYEPAKLPVSFGLAYSNSFNNYGFPRLTAFGIGVDLQPNPAHELSPYLSYYYFPDQTGTYPLANPNDPTSGSFHSAFVANELDFGGLFTIPKTALSIAIGYYQTTNVRKTGTFNFVRDGPYVGVGYRIK